MTEEDYAIVAYDLLSTLAKIAPRGSAQYKLAEHYNEMVAGGETWKYIAKSMCGVLQDGLNYGNWPWVLEAMRDGK